MASPLVAITTFRCTILILLGLEGLKETVLFDTFAPDQLLTQMVLLTHCMGVPGQHLLSSNECVNTIDVCMHTTRLMLLHKMFWYVNESDRYTCVYTHV